MKKFIHRVAEEPGLAFIVGTIVLVGMLLMADCAKGEELSFLDRHEISLGYAPGCSHLWSDKDDYNEDNNHLFMLQFDQWFGMTFRNSYYDRCFAFGYTFRTEKWTPLEDKNFFLRGNLPIGVVHGYHNRNLELGGWAPAAIPALEVGYMKVSANITAFPIACVMLTITF